MNGILREIFDDEYDITPKRGKRQREIDEQLCGEWDKIKAVFGSNLQTDSSRWRVSRRIGGPSTTTGRGSAWGRA